MHQVRIQLIEIVAMEGGFSTISPKDIFVKFGIDNDFFYTVFMG